ncbi:MAG: LacI family transcriptional regulator [Oscillospiraceae bacterium]|nr:LacI family transcriptional regulator [Oscillospiraceae bacterium]
MTLKEIAKLAGVSASTVSRIINSPDGSFARQEVRDKVWETVRKTGYIPNQNARALKCKIANHHEKSAKIDFIFGNNSNIIENNFFEKISRAAEKQAIKLENRILHSYIFANKDFSSLKADGAIAFGFFKENELKILKKNYKNVVYIGFKAFSLECDQIVCDIYESVRKALLCLIEKGHKKIAYIGASYEKESAKAYTETIKNYCLPYEKQIICSESCSIEDGFNAVKLLIDSKEKMPTAFFCTSDQIAAGAIKCLKKAKINVPEDISVIGTGNTELSVQISPMLSTINFPTDEIGSIALNTLLDKINKCRMVPIKIFIPSQLIIRESVAGILEFFK